MQDDNSWATSLWIDAIEPEGHNMMEHWGNTVKPDYNDHLMGYISAKGHLDELQKADMVSKCKLVPSVQDSL